MSDTTITGKTNGAESTIFGVSVRAWMAIIAITTVCVTHLIVALATVYFAITTKDFNLVGTLTTVGEPLYSLAIGSVGYYFGSSKSKQTGSGTGG